MSKVALVIDWFYRAPVREGLHDFTDIVGEAASAALNLDGMERDAYVHSNWNRTWNALIQEEEERSKRGLTLFFGMLKDTRKLYWLAAKPATANSERRRLMKLRSRPLLLSHIHTLNWRQYEALGCLTSRYCGAVNVHLTPPGNECGIDFFACISLFGNNHIFSGTRSPLRIVGQSKKYATPVEMDKVRAFNDTLTDVKKLEPRVSPIIPAWFKASRGPIIGWIVSHCGFQSGARARAHNHGILISDSHDLAEVAAMTRVVDEAHDPSQRVATVSQQIDALLREYDG